MPFLTKNSSLPVLDHRTPRTPGISRRGRRNAVVDARWRVERVGSQFVGHICHPLAGSGGQLRASLLARSLQQALARCRNPPVERGTGLCRGRCSRRRRRPACRRRRTWEGCLRWSGRAELPPHGRWRQSSTPTPHSDGTDTLGNISRVRSVESSGRKTRLFRSAVSSRQAIRGDVIQPYVQNVWLYDITADSLTRLTADRRSPVFLPLNRRSRAG